MKKFYQNPTFKLFIIVFILLSIKSYAQPIQFEQHIVDSSFIDGFDVIADDINNDGYTDLLAVGKDSNLISWFKNENTTGETVIDFDGNVYQTIEIGDQIWMKENLKSLHYSDGTEITEVWAYDDNEANVEIYGRLYTWDGAMKYSIAEGAQGACPDGWHIPTDSEWTDLGNFLGGDAVAGGKLKDVGTALWQAPNTGATNESGFTALPAGEFDDTHYQLINQYAIIWSSTETSDAWCKYRYLAFDDAELHTYNYYKNFRYSIRCLKDGTTGINSNLHKQIKINLSPNPAFETLNIQYPESLSQPIQIELHDITGVLLKTKVVGTNHFVLDISDLPKGIYFVTACIDEIKLTEKFVKN